MGTSNDLHSLLKVAREIRSDVPTKPAPPKAEYSVSSKVVPQELVIEARPYIQEIAKQINGLYEHGWFDACLVMMRRLMETLLIECFENRECSSAITNSDGDYVSLSKIISKSESGHHISFSRHAPKKMKRIKRHADNSAHNRWYTASRTEVDELLSPFQILINELIEISELSTQD